MLKSLMKQSIMPNSMIMLSSLLTITMIVTIPLSAQHDQDPELEWLQNLIRPGSSVHYKAVKLEFFLQDRLAGPNATVWEVSRCPITDQSPTDFGLVKVLDDVITKRPDPASPELGRAQGIITSSDMASSALNMNLNFVFTAGDYKGSTLTVLGRNPITTTNRELPVIGGTGVFRMARGYAFSSTYSFDGETQHGVLGYKVYVAYPDVSEPANKYLAQSI